MARCNLCNHLQKKDTDDVRAAFDFTPEQLLLSVTAGECTACGIMMEGISRFEDGAWAFIQDVRAVNAQCLADNNESLSLTLYFHDDRPRLAIEFFYKNDGSQGERSLPFSSLPRAEETC